LQWRRKKDTFIQTSSHWPAFHGQKVKFSEIKKLSSYLNDSRQQFDYVVLSEMYQLKALEIMKEIESQGFNAS
jgi:hypothetical protein